MEQQMVARQKLRLVDKIEEHALRCERLGVPRNLNENFWQNISSSLNELGPPRYDWNGWKKSYDQLILQAKAKIALLNKERNTTGGGSPISSTLSENDSKIDALNNVNKTYGEPDLSECGFENLYDSQNDDENMCEAGVNDQMVDRQQRATMEDVDCLTRINSELVDFRSRRAALLQSCQVRADPTELLSGRQRNNRSLANNVNIANMPRHNVRMLQCQKLRLIEMAEKNFKSIVGTFHGPNGRELKKEVWCEIAVVLNALGPPSKTWKEWKTTYSQLKSRMRAKIGSYRTDNNRSIVSKRVQGSSHGHDNVRTIPTLSSTEQTLIRMYGLDNLDGLQNLSETGFPRSDFLPLRDIVNIPERRIEDTLANHASVLLPMTIRNEVREHDNSAPFVQLHSDFNEIQDCSQSSYQYENDIGSQLVVEPLSSAANMDSERETVSAVTNINSDEETTQPLLGVEPVLPTVVIPNATETATRPSLIQAIHAEGVDQRDDLQQHGVTGRIQRDEDTEDETPRHQRGGLRRHGITRRQRRRIQTDDDTENDTPRHQRGGLRRHGITRRQRRRIQTDDDTENDTPRHQRGGLRRHGITRRRQRRRIQTDEDTENETPRLRNTFTSYEMVVNGMKLQQQYIAECRVNHNAMIQGFAQLNQSIVSIASAIDNAANLFQQRNE